VSSPTVDLSLPSTDQLLGAAAPNPEVEAARLTATGNPDQVADVGVRLQRAGSDLDQLYSQSNRTQQVLGGGFANNGAPVYDPQTHRESLPPGFADAGTRLHDAGRRIALLSLELKSAIDDVKASQAGLFGTLNGRRLSFAAEIDGARGPGGLIPVEALPALQARRASVAADMQQLVNTCGRDIIDRVGVYQTSLEGCQRMLGELGVPGSTTAGGRSGFPGAQLEGQPGQVLGNPPVPGGGSVQIFPLPPGVPSGTGLIPAPGVGPLITLPGPNLGTGVQDGPGSGQRQDTPPITIDAAGSSGGRQPGPIPPPGVLPGFPGTRPGRAKTPVRGGGQLRKRWVLPSGEILEWDYQHGEVEKYNKRGKHLGAFDPITGEQTKDPDPTRKVEP
jgi:Cytotoxic